MNEATTIEQRTVRVVNRDLGPSWDRQGYYGLRIELVTVRWECPRCGGPRGEPRPHRFAEDGEFYVCDRWDNPCGHVDYYDDVIREARR